MVVASDDGTCCVAAVAGDGLAGDASLSGDHPSNDKRGCDGVQGCRVDREEVDREKDDGEEDDRQDNSRKKDDREKVDREEAERERDDGKEDLGE